jgi:tRNA uridine 5-carboxymethylaminomethyl modification enzyme
MCVRYRDMWTYEKYYDVIVIGAGHAGCEAALAAARMGCETLLLTMNLDTVAQMSCNPAIGGIAKGHLVKEIDALGGEMAKNIDKTGIQFRQLNTSKGPAVRSSRAQADKKAYQFTMKGVIEDQPRLDLKQGTIDDIIVEHETVKGVITKAKTVFLGRTVVLTTGTFLKGLIHIGDFSYSSGRAGESSAEKTSDGLRRLGFEVGRLKTGTPPRVNSRGIDYSSLDAQPGDDPPKPFSWATEAITRPQMVCHLTYTTERTHDIIRTNLHRSAMYGGRIVGIGPRYCPSMEDKIVKFPEKERHHIFLEPEGLHTREVYLNGISMSLPEDVQVEVIRSLPGLEQAEIMRPAYAVEYDFLPPTQIRQSFESKPVRNLFLAGQINGTTGYEEAAAQGMMAGINAALNVMGEEPFILDRSQAYIGVLVDDLTTKGVTEPYRMFTSLAEYRLLLREDNADLRLIEYGRRFGLIPDEAYCRMVMKREQTKEEIERLSQTRITPTERVQEILRRLGSAEITKPMTLADLLRRPEISYNHLYEIAPSEIALIPGVGEQVEVEIKYEGYIRRQDAQVAQFRKLEAWKISEDFDYDSISVLAREAREKLARIRPRSLGQASRISGVSPADISVLMVILKARQMGRHRVLGAEELEGANTGTEESA